MPPADPALDLLTDVLASYRAARLVTTDRVTLPLRQRLLRAAAPDPDPDPDHPPHPALSAAAYLVTCDHCTAVYTSAVLAIFRTAPLPPSAGGTLRTARYALAVAGAVSLLREVLDR